MQRLTIERFKALSYESNEAMNALCTNLFFAGGDIRRIMITSCRPQEGKSFVAMNLLRSMAALGKKVVLVDADIRASALQGSYGIRAESEGGGKLRGLTHYLAGQCPTEDVLYQTDLLNAWMVLAGKTVNNSLPLLNTPRLGTLLDDLARRFDIVIVDAPPVGTIIDAACIASSCDGTLFVVQSGEIPARELQESIHQIEKSGSPILGTVLNKYDERRYGTRYYYGKNSYYYGAKSGTHHSAKGLKAGKKRR